LSFAAGFKKDKMVAHEKQIHELIEETGKVLEKFGLTPMQGRIVAFFTVSDPPEKTFDELVKYFQASKSSISNSLNFLLNNKIIDYKTFLYDRKRYFFITDYFFRYYFEKVLENVRELKEHTFRTVSLRSPEHPSVNEKILKWIGNANMFQDTLEKTIAEIKKDAI
jgi:DNA-binding transcriptional regulator GbsR (MarR family)